MASRGAREALAARELQLERKAAEVAQLQVHCIVVMGATSACGARCCAAAAAVSAACATPVSRRPQACPAGRALLEVQQQKRGIAKLLIVPRL